MVFDRRCLEVLNRLFVESGKLNHLSKAYVIDPMKELAIEIFPFVQSIDDHLYMGSNLNRPVPKYQHHTGSHAALYESVRVVYASDKRARPNYPFISFGIGAEGFCLRTGLSYTSRGTMDTIRNMAIDHIPLFMEAWNIYTNQEYFKLSGTTYKGARFRRFPKDVQEILEYRTIGFVARDENTEALFEGNFADYLVDKLKIIAPMYRVLAEAEAEAEAGNYSSHDPLEE